MPVISAFSVSYLTLQHSIRLLCKAFNWHPRVDANSHYINCMCQYQCLICLHCQGRTVTIWHPGANILLCAPLPRREKYTGLFVDFLAIWRVHCKIYEI